MERTILHIDLNNFYASVEIRDNPKLAAFPVAVGGDESARHGIILAKNYKAKAFGVTTAEPIWEAKKKCPGLIVLPPRFEKYEDVSKRSRALMATYSDNVEPFGLDEAWIDISAYAKSAEAGKVIADEIRGKYKYNFGLTVSVGVSYNKIFAKLGSDMKKPDATTVITPSNFHSLVWNLPATELLFVGKKTGEKLKTRGIITIGDLAAADKKLIHAWLGVSGDKLRAYANGLDKSPVLPLGSAAAVKSIGNSSTPPRDLYDAKDALALIQSLSENIAKRLRKQNLLAETVALFLRDTSLFSFERQIKLNRPTCLAFEIRNAAFRLLRENYDFRKPLRSLGVRAVSLVSGSAPRQLTFFSDEAERDKRLAIENTIDILREKYGNSCIKAGAAAAASGLGEMLSDNANPLGMTKFNF